MADNNTPRTFTDADFADDPSTLKPVKASAVRKLGDLALGFGQGAVGATKALSDAFGANNAVSQGLEGVNQFLDAGISGETKDRRFEADRIQQEAKGKGIAAEVAGFGKAFATDPIQQTVQGLGSVAPFVAAQFVPGVGQSATAARLAQVGMGLGMGAGTAKGAIHEEVQKRELAAGKTAEQAQAAADAAQAYGGANTDQIALGGVLGLADAATGATPAAVRLLRQKLGKEVAKAGAQKLGKETGEGVFKAGAKGALEEMPVEFAQGGQEQLAANIAAQRAGYQADTWEGVVGKGGMEALASTGPGAAFGIAGRNHGAGPQPDPNAPQGGVAFDSNVPPTLDARALEAAGVSMPPPAAVLDSGRIDRMVDLGTAQPSDADLIQQQDGGSGLISRTFDPRAGVAPPLSLAPNTPASDSIPYQQPEQKPFGQNFAMPDGGPPQQAFDDVQPLSKRMGLDSAVGPLSATAVTAVDSGASPAAAALASGVGGGFGIGRARGEPVDVTPINQSAGQIGATKRLGETPIIDVEARWKDEGPRQGDMMAPNNAPFQSQALALQASQQTQQGGEVVAVPNGFVVRPQLLGIEQPTQSPRLGYDGERKSAATRLVERQPTAQAPQQQPAQQKYQPNTARTPESRQNTVQPSAEPPRLGMTPAQQRTVRQQPPVRDGSTPIAMGMEGGGQAATQSNKNIAPTDGDKSVIPENDAVNQAAGAFAQGGERAPDGDALEKKVDEVIEAQKLIRNPASRDHVKKTIIEKGFDAADKAIAGYKKQALINARAKRSESQVISDAVDDANDQGLHGDERKDWVHSALAKEWDMNVKDVAKQKNVAAALKKKLTPEQEAKVAARKEEKANAFFERIKRQALKASARMDEQIARGDTNVDLVSSLQQEAPARPANWRKNMISAAKVAKGVGISSKGKKLADLVAEIDAADAETKSSKEPASATATAQDDNKAKADALSRIERGTAYFGTKEKAEAFIANGGISATHEAVQSKPGRFEVRAKASSQPTPSQYTPVGKNYDGNELAQDFKKLSESKKPPQETEADAVNTATPPVAHNAAATASNTSPFEYNGLKIRTSRIKVGDEVQERWVVQSPENAERESRGERQIGGDRIVATREQAIHAAEQESKAYAERKALKEQIDAEDDERKAQNEAKKEANRGKSVVERRRDAFLDSPSKVGSGTKREVIEAAVRNGYAIVEKTVIDTASKNRDRKAVDRAFRAGYILGLSNENIPIVKEGNAAKARLKEDKYEKPEYRIYSDSREDGPFREISKIEYEYAQKLKKELADAPSSTQADNIDPLLNKLASGYGYSGGIDTMPAGLGTTARKLHKAIIDGDVAMVQKILHPDNKRSREAFEKLFDGRVKLPSTVRDTNNVIQGFMGKVSAALAENIEKPSPSTKDLMDAAQRNGKLVVANVGDKLAEARLNEKEEEKLVSLIGRSGGIRVDYDAENGRYYAKVTHTNSRKAQNKVGFGPTALGAKRALIDELEKPTVEPDLIQQIRDLGVTAESRIEQAAEELRNGDDRLARTVLSDAKRAIRLGLANPAQAAKTSSTVEFIKALEEAKKELPAGYSISPQIGSLSLMQNGKYAINGLSRTADGVMEAVRLAKLREAEAKKDEAIKNEQPKPLPDDSILDDELKDALGKLGDVLGDVFGAKLNATGQQYTAGDLLPALSKVVELLVKKGFKSFSQSTGKAAQLMRADPRTAAHVDSISPRQWKAAYNAIAEGFEGTDTEDTINAMKSDEVLAIVAPQTAPKPKAGTTAPAKTLAESLYQAILANQMPKDNPALKKLVESFDGKPADQARMKQAQEELETAIAMTARDLVAKNEGDRSTFGMLLRLYESQPNLNIRTSTSVANQAYSTPAPLAFLASRLAGVTKATSVHEPTAGTGMLLIGADPKKAIVNELNDLRIDALKLQGFSPTQKDAATQLLVANGVKPDSVVTNPPFGSIKDADGKPVKVKVDGYSLGQIDHLIAARALDTMKEDGRATLIIGANKSAGGLNTDDRIFFNWLYSHYNVAGHFEVEGDLYTRQGAGWPVRVIAINGRQKSNNFSPVAGTIQRVDNWSDVYEQFTKIIESEKYQGTINAKADGGRKQSPSPVESPEGTGQGQPTGGQGGAGGIIGTSPRDALNRPESTPISVGSGSDEQRLNAQSSVPRPQYGQNPAGAAKPAKPAGVSALSESQGNEFQAPYNTRSARKDDGVLIPANMAQPTQDALSRLEDAVGDIDEFARKELGYATVDDLHGALMGLQVDSVAMSIHQIKQGKAVVIADQTGIGKGRQAASIIRWAARHGMTPVFMSVKPSLFTDMYGDLADIGTNDVTPFIMNGDAWVAGEGGAKLFSNKPSTHRRTIQGIADSGQLPNGSNALFLTYSQINVANVQRQALMALAPNAVFVLDESHNAAGASSTGEFVIGALEAAKGVVYLSATYAKRPDNMPLYFKTDIGLAAADTEGLAEAMAAGGLPLQTVVSNNLVKAGQMFRRERSYDGVSIASVFDSANRSLHERMSNAATKALRAIVQADSAFHEIYVKQLADQLAESGATVIDSAGNQIQKTVQHTEFSSVVHNFVKQMLLGLKAQSAADEAIASLKRGEKPIIAVENTMGSFLKEYAEANRIGQGDSLGTFDYRTVLSRALARSRVVIEVAANGDKIKRPVELGELDFLTRSYYKSAQEVIDSLTLNIPVSPIDWMRAEIERAGYTVAEITGRDLSVDYSNPDNPILSAIDSTEQKDKVNTTRQFNGGKLDALILNVAGSTGISLHASEKFEDQRQRHMIVAQAAGDINIFMQMLGRIHRTGQVRLPKYTILSVDLPTEKRPTAVLSTKMKSLNANTSSNTESATSVKTVDILNKYGDQIVAQYLRDNIQLAKALGMEEDADSEEGAREDIARKATGRLALQPIATQHAFYDEVEAQYNALIEYLNKTNQNDLEPRTFDFDAKEIRQEVLFEGPNKETPFGEDAIYGEYSIKAQGTPMKPDEIRAAMSENLNGATPEAHTQKLMGDLEAKFLAFYSTLDDAGKVGASGVRESARAFLMSHGIGSKFRIEINGESFNAVVLNVRNTHKDTGNPYSLSKLQVSVAVNGALRSLSVPATQFSKIEVASIAPVYQIDVLFKEQPPNQRETAKIITGNITAAYGELEGVRGTIVNFTKQDGTIEQGILLPKAFDYSKNTRGDYRLQDGAAALKFLQKSEDKDIGRFGIMTRDGVVRVLPSGQGIRVQVPKTKLKGGKYFLDKALIEVAGDFVTQGQSMVATVYEPADATKMLDLLMKKQALYALPSMAEEAKALTGDKNQQSHDDTLKMSRVGQGQTAAPQPAIPRTPKAKIKATLDRAYGRLFGRLESKGLVTLTQTQQEAIEAAARARAEKLGRDYQDELDGLMSAVSASRAWHGSPSKGITQFDPEKTTRGVHGWGVYFGDKAEIAEKYAPRTSSYDKINPVKFDGKRVARAEASAASDIIKAAKTPEQRMTNEYAEAFFKLQTTLVTQKNNFKEGFEQSVNDQRALDEKLASSGVKDYGPRRLSSDEWKFLQDWYEKNQSRFGWSKQQTPKVTGQVYEVEIPDESEMLAWDEPLSEQPKKTLAALKKMGLVTSATPPATTGKQIYASLVQKIQASNKDVNAKRQASLELLANGIKGNRSKVSGLYAVFSGADIQIVDVKYSANGVVQGFFDPATKQAFLIADGLTEDTAGGVLMHEVGIHMAASGGKLAPLVNRAAFMVKNAKGAFFDDVRKKMAKAGETSAEEAAAYLVEAYENSRGSAPSAVKQWFKDFVAAVRAWLFKAGGGLILSANQLTAADIAAVARANARGFARGGGGGGGGNSISKSMGASNVPIQSTDEDGMPVINGDGVTLQFGEPTERIEFIPVDDGQKMIRFQIGTESNPFAGQVDVLFENGKPTSLYDIEIDASERGKRLATKTVKALLDASPNGKLDISNIVTEAQEFWATLGIPTQPNLPTGYAYDGTITRESYEASPAAKNARAAQRMAQDWAGDGQKETGSTTGQAAGIEAQELSWEDAQKMGIRFSRTGGNGQPPTGAVPNYFDVKGAANQAKEGMADRLADWRGMSMQALGRRQIVDLWGKLLPQLGRYDDLVQKMDAEKNATAAGADELATAWAELDGKGFLGLGKAKNAGMEARLAELMHDATLGGVDADPSVPLPNDATIAQKMAKGAFSKRFDALTPDAQAVYRKVRDIYADQNKAIRKALTERIERAAELSPDSKRTMIAQMDAEMMWEKQGVYFPLARFGKYLVVVKDASGKTMSVSRAETLPESKKLRAELQSRYPSDQGFRVSKVYLDHEFNAARDAVGKGFMGDLVQTLRNEGMDEGVIDSVGQLYLKSLPDLSWAKHGIHRKGTPGFSQDARRAFAQNMIHGASHLAKLRYADRLQMELTDMQAHIKANQDDDGFDNVKAVQVYDEMVKRHDLLMSPKTHPLSTALTSAGFLFYLGLSPASAAVNLSQTALLAYPIMGAKWGYDKAGAALLKASAEVTKAKNDYRSVLQGDELKALNQAIDDGTIDVTMAHDLAGIANGEDQRVTWAMRPVMRAASFMFHHAEKFNRQATFIAAYRLARENPKTTHEQAFAEARKATYDGHFDYSAANRPRVMQGNWAKVLLLFKQYGQNMVYTLARQTYLSIKGDTPEQKKEARKAIAGILALHASAAGVLGLPVVGTLLALASAMGGDDDEPWDAKVAIQNALAESLGQKPAEVLAHGLSRLTPWDMSGRVALNSLILPDVQEGLEGQRLAESAMTAALGPVAGIGTGIAKGIQKMSQGDYLRGFEDILPVALRNPLKAYRYGTQGNVDKTGVVINDEVSAAGVAGQALGFSPSETRLAAEGKQAIYQADKRLSERRAQLVRLYSMAKMADDDEGVTEAREAIARFNAKNPDRKITVIQLAQSVKSRQKRIAEAQQGVYLPEKRRGALEAGRFAVTE